MIRMVPQLVAAGWSPSLHSSSSSSSSSLDTATLVRELGLRPNQLLTGWRYQLLGEQAVQVILGRVALVSSPEGLRVKNVYRTLYKTS